MKALLQTELKKRQTRLLGHCKALPQTAGDARFVDTLPTWANYQNDTSINGIWGNLVVTHTEDRYGADGYDGTIPTTILRHTNPDNLLLWKYNGLKGPGQY